MLPTSRSIVQCLSPSHHHHDEITLPPQLSQLTLHPPPLPSSDSKHKIVSQVILYWTSESHVISHHVIIQLLGQIQRAPSLSIRPPNLLNLVRHLGPESRLIRGLAQPAGSGRRPMRKYPTYPPPPFLHLPPPLSSSALNFQLIYSHAPKNT